MEGGFTLQDGIGAANILEQAGIDLLDISGGFCGYVSPCCKGQGCFRVVTHAIKTAVRVPVILTGGITQAETAEMLLKDEKADLIFVGRAFLKFFMGKKRRKPWRRLRMLTPRRPALQNKPAALLSKQPWMF